MMDNPSSNGQSIRSILVANRGEIASRIFRTCRKMGIRSIAVYSEADQQMPFVSHADIAVFIGESNPMDCYLNQDKVIKAAKRTNAEAIHPGYGFLSENVHFCKRCIEEGIIFIGPHSDAIEAMGSKSNAKLLMENHGVPIVPGYHGDDQSIERITKEASQIGYPLLLKASAGGGGKGMRIVNNENELRKSIDTAQREALESFGEKRLIIEKYIASGRHIEFQIFGDQHGNVIHLLERECTIQRRYQKVIEESPSPILNEDLRSTMGHTAVKVAKAMKYDNAGTVEFIYDEKADEFYFLEVNTRLQVEHPVTEAITGLDLVQLQIQSAEGKRLSLSQQDVKGCGYALEVRLYAEDVQKNFMPVTGKIEKFVIPDVTDLRVESAVMAGSEISIFYDPMIAKIIVWGQHRMEAIRKMTYVLRNLICLGTRTNQSFLLAILNTKDFHEGNYDTQFITKHLSKDRLIQSPRPCPEAFIAATLKGWIQRQQTRTTLRSLPSGWRNSFYEHQKIVYLFEDL